MCVCVAAGDSPAEFEPSTLAGRKLKPNLALRGFLRKHELLDSFDDVLNRGVVSFQAAVQFVDLGSKLAASISRMRTKARTTKTLISIACLELSTVAAMIAPRSVKA